MKEHISKGETWKLNVNFCQTNNGISQLNSLILMRFYRICVSIRMNEMFSILYDNCVCDTFTWFTLFVPL